MLDIRQRYSFYVLFYTFREIFIVNASTNYLSMNYWLFIRNLSFCDKPSEIFIYSKDLLRCSLRFLVLFTIFLQL